MKVRNLIFILLSLSIFMYVSCSMDEEGDDDIAGYLKKNQINAIGGESGLYYIIDEPGNDKKPKLNSDVKVKYKGYFLDHKVFDPGDTPFETNISNPGIIAGWRKGLIHFNEGSKGRLFIPSALGYGDTGQGSIPPKAALIFDIDMLEVKN